MALFSIVCCVMLMGMGAHVQARHYSFTRADHINHIGARDEPISGMSLAGPSVTVGVDTGVLAGVLDPRGGHVVLHRDTQCADDTEFGTNAHYSGVRAGTVHYPQLTLPSRTTPLQLPQANVYASSHVSSNVFPEADVTAFDWWLPGDELCAFVDDAELCVAERKGDEYHTIATAPLPARAQSVHWSPTLPVGVVCTELTSEQVSVHFFSYNQEARELTITPLGMHLGEVTVAEWSADGTKLLIAEYNQSQQSGWRTLAALYQYDDTGMHLLTRRYFHESPHGAGLGQIYHIISCAWRHDGNALILGGGWKGSGITHRRSQVLLFDVRDDDMTLAGSIDDIGADVTALQFVPEQDARCLIGLSHGGGGNRIRSCTARDDARGIPILERERSYPFPNDVDAMVCNPDGDLLAVAEHARSDIPGAVRLYKVNGIDISRCYKFEHHSAIQQLAWDRHGTLLTTVLDGDEGVLETRLVTGMVFENLRVLGDSQVNAGQELYLHGRVHIDAQSRVWRTAEQAEWHFADHAVARLSNMTFDIPDQLVLSGADTVECQLYNVTLQSGSLYCQAPVHVVTSFQTQGSIAGRITFEPFSRLVLNGNTELSGEISIDGVVTIEGGGNELDVSRAHIQIQPGGLLRVSNTRLKGFGQALTMDGTSSVEMVNESVFEMPHSGRFEAGTFSFIESKLVYQHWRYSVSGLTFVADGTKELWHHAQEQGVWGSSDGASENSGASPVGSTGSDSGTGGESGTAHDPSVLTPTGPSGGGDSSGVAPVTPSTGTGGSVGMGVIEIATPHYYLDHDLYLAPDAPGSQGTRLHITTNTVIHGNYRRIFGTVQSEDPLITVDSMCHVKFVDVALESFRPHMIAPTAGNTTAKVTWGQNSWVNLRGDGVLQLPWRLAANGHIDGNSHSIGLQARAPLIIDEASNVVIERAAFYNVAGNNIAATDDSSVVTLSNVQCHLSDTMHIPYGEWHFRQNVSFIGPHAVVYSSSQQARIHDDATLVCDNNSTDVLSNDYSSSLFEYNHNTFVYAPVVDRIDGLVCDSKGTIGLYNSELFCNDRSLHLPQGRIVVDGVVTLREEGDGALILGGSASGEEDDPGARVSFEYRSSRADIHVFGHIVMTLSR